MELNTSWTERASKHSLCYGCICLQLKESQTKQQSQTLSFWTRQLAALIHLFYSALLQTTYSLAIYLFCWLQFLLPSLPMIQQPCSVWYTLFAVLCSSVRESQEAWVWVQVPLLAGQAAARHIGQCCVGNGRVPRCLSPGQDGACCQQDRPDWVSCALSYFECLLFWAVFLPCSNSRGSSGVMGRWASLCLAKGE